MTKKDIIYVCKYYSFIIDNYYERVILENSYKFRVDLPYGYFGDKRFSLLQRLVKNFKL